jgi:hypothetical protein
MDLAKKVVLLAAVIFICLTGVVTAADRMVIAEMITNTS